MLKNIGHCFCRVFLLAWSQDTYTSLPPESSLDYDEVESALLRAYELVPESYHQMFRWSKKTDNLTYFSHSKKVMFVCSTTHM